MHGLTGGMSVKFLRKWLAQTMVAQMKHCEQLHHPPILSYSAQTGNPQIRPRRGWLLLATFFSEKCRNFCWVLLWTDRAYSCHSDCQTHHYLHPHCLCHWSKSWSRSSSSRIFSQKSPVFPMQNVTGHVKNIGVNFMRLLCHAKRCHLYVTRHSTEMG